MRHLLRRGLDEVAIFIVLPFAGSALYQDSKIALSDDSVQPTFGPKGRVQQNLYGRRRAIMMRLFSLKSLSLA